MNNSAYGDLAETLIQLNGRTINNGYFTDLVSGEVKSINPAVVSLSSGIDVFEGSSLFLSPFCKKKTITNTHYHIYQDHDTNDGEGASGGNPQVDAHTSIENTQLVLWNDLQVGEKVLLLKCGKGQKYYCLQRI